MFVRKGEADLMSDTIFCNIWCHKRKPFITNPIFIRLIWNQWRMKVVINDYLFTKFQPHKMCVRLKNNIWKLPKSPKPPYTPYTFHNSSQLTPFLLRQSIYPINISPMLILIHNIFKGRQLIEIIIDQAHQVVGHFNHLQTSNYIRRSYW